MENKKTTIARTGGVSSVRHESRTAKSVGDALLKAALGCRVAEVTEEYAEVDGELKLLKRKKTKKDIPPDLKAVQLLIQTGEEKDISALSDEELEEEKKRLLRLLYENEKNAAREKDDLEKNTPRAGKTTVKKSTVKKSHAGKSNVKKAAKTRRKKTAGRGTKSGDKLQQTGEITAESAENK